MPGDVGAIGVEVRARYRRPGRASRGRVDDQAGQACIGNHPGETLRRIIGIQRHVRGARLQDGEDRHQVIRRAWQADADARACAGTTAEQLAGEAVGLRVERRVAQPVVPVHLVCWRAARDDGHRIRPLLRLAGHQLVDRYRQGRHAR
ncbi:MAG: hypothetical protein OEU93_16645 [Rubrivivax sp.]|nr:hypothetical protein [Rubrivivax sp.]